MTNRHSDDKQVPRQVHEHRLNTIQTVQKSLNNIHNAQQSLNICSKSSKHTNLWIYSKTFTFKEFLIYVQQVQISLHDIQKVQKNQKSLSMFNKSRIIKQMFKNDSKQSNRFTHFWYSKNQKYSICFEYAVLHGFSI